MFALRAPRVGPRSSCRGRTVRDAVGSYEYACIARELVHRCSARPRILATRKSILIFREATAPAATWPPSLPSPPRLLTHGDRARRLGTGPLNTTEAVPSCYSNMWRTQWHYTTILQVIIPQWYSLGLIPYYEKMCHDTFIDRHPKFTY